MLVTCTTEVGVAAEELCADGSDDDAISGAVEATACAVIVVGTPEEGKSRRARGLPDFDRPDDERQKYTPIMTANAMMASATMAMAIYCDLCDVCV